jgi:hypothetical protein
MAMTGLVAFSAGSLFPIRFKKGESIDSLRKSVSAKNVEIQKLKSMVYEYEFQIAELKKALFQSEQEALKRDYEEFKQPDVNGDDVISRMEVRKFFFKSFFFFFLFHWFSLLSICHLFLFGTHRFIHFA